MMVKMGIETITERELLMLALLVLWTLPWKGYALWTAARLKHRGWFVALLVLNTLAILEIIYIFHVAKKGGELWNLLRGQRN